MRGRLSGILSVPVNACPCWQPCMALQAPTREPLNGRRALPCSPRAQAGLLKPPAMTISGISVATLWRADYAQCTGHQVLQVRGLQGGPPHVQPIPSPPVLPASLKYFSAAAGRAARSVCTIRGVVSDGGQPLLPRQHCRLKLHQYGGLGLGLPLHRHKVDRHPAAPQTQSGALASQSLLPQHAMRAREQGLGSSRGAGCCADLAGNPAPSRTPFTMPATNAAQLSAPMSLGTEMYLLTNRS